MHPEAGELAAQLRHFRAVSCMGRGAAMQQPKNKPRQIREDQAGLQGKIKGNALILLGYLSAEMASAMLRVAASGSG